jgi:WD40 repeat protein
VQRYLNDEPVLACPPSMGYRLRKFARRNRRTLLVAMLAGGVLAASAVLLVSLRHNAQLQAAIAREMLARQAEAEARHQLEVHSYYHRIALANLEWRDNHLPRAIQLLDGCPRELRDWEWHYLQRVCHPDRLTLAEHCAPLTGVAYSSDGVYLASADDTGTILLRDAASGRPVHSFPAHAGGVRGLSFSPDSRCLAFTAGPDVKIWDIAGCHELASLEGHQQPVVSLAFSRDGTRLACSTRDQVVTVWETIAPKGVPAWKARASWKVPPLHKVLPENLRLPLVFSADGQRLASVVSNRNVRVWDVATGQTIVEVAWPGETLSLACSPDGALLAGGGGDGCVRLWSLAPGPQRGVIVQLLQGHNGPVTALAFSPDGQRLASGSSDQTIKIWDATPPAKGLSAPGEELWTLKGHTAEVVGLAFAPDGRHLASADRGGSVKLWDADFRPELMALKGHEQLVAMAFTADGGHFLTAGEEQTLKMWHVPSGRLLRSVPIRDKLAGNHGDFSPDGQLFACAAGAAPPRFPVKIWDTSTGNERQVLLGHTRPLFSVRFSPDNRRLATAGFDRAVRVWDVGTGQQTYLLAGHTGTICRLAFSPDGTQLASAGKDTTIRLWDMTTGKELRVLRGHMERIWGLSFDPSGKQLASVSGDGKVIIWSVSGGGPLLILDGHLEHGAAGVAFSPDGTRLITAGFDHTIKVWDAASGENPLSLPGGPDSRGGVQGGVGVVFSPDGWRFATASPNTVRIWDATARER